MELQEQVDRQELAELQVRVVQVVRQEHQDRAALMVHMELQVQMVVQGRVE